MNGEQRGETDVSGTGTRHTGPDDTGPDESISDESISDESISDESISDESISDGIALNDTASDDTASAGTGPGAAGPPGTGPRRTGPREEIAGRFVAEVESGRLDLPLPGAGRTRRRWEALGALARHDLSLARLCEGHADALAILAELSGPAPARGSRWGVWAAQPPGPPLSAVPEGGGWRLHGTKRYCSGARVCTHALVTAGTPDGPRLFAVGTRDLRPVAGSWPATGMAASDTLDVRFDAVPAEPVGPVDGYVKRPGFHHGGAGVAACWYGGARGIAETLLTAAGERDVGPHALAHLGAVDVALRAARSALERSADEIDADPHDLKNAGRQRSLRLKTLVEAVATEVMGRVGRALGAGPLAHDGPHGRRVADLTVYLRQHHAERDLATLGALVAEQGAAW